jgi:hypothetical protein
LADQIDKTCDSAKLVDDIAMLMLKDVNQGYARIDQCDLTYAARKALQFFKPRDTEESVVQRTILFYHTAKADLTEQVETRAKEIYRQREWFQKYLDKMLNPKPER